MNRETISQEMQVSINKWEQLREFRGQSASLTEGAKETLIQMIVNIESDPSPYWADIDKDSLQRYVISIIPNMLMDLTRRGRLFRRHRKISSWEILHEISNVLDNWCPVPKNI